jgi:sarcosine oxidase subunit alpha
LILPMPSTTPFAVHRSPLHHWHVARGARFAECDGWQVPLAYADPRDEVGAARSGVGLADVSPFAKLSLRGPGVPALAAALGNLAPRRVLPVAGGLACRLSEQCLYLLASSTSKASLAQRIASPAEIEQIDVTSAYAGFVVIGQNVEPLIRRLTAFDVSISAFPDGACAETELAGVRALLVRPARAVPEIAVYVAWDVGEYVWESILHAGRDLGIVPVGWEAMISLGVAQAK